MLKLLKEHAARASLSVLLLTGQLIKGQLHGALSTPGWNLTLLTVLKFFRLHGRFQPRGLKCCP
jgi:hypothetical protein